MWFFPSGYGIQKYVTRRFHSTFQNLPYFDQSVAYVVLWVINMLVSGRVRGSQEQRPDRTVERSKREKVRERKGRGKILPNSFVSNPSFLFMLFNFLLANNPTKYDFYDKTLFFIFRPFFLFPEQLSELKSSKSLRKSVRRSYLFLCFGSLPAPLVIPSCTVIDPTAQYLYHCASALSVTVWSKGKPCTPCH
jgi:hypothetical protein